MVYLKMLVAISLLALGTACTEKSNPEQKTLDSINKSSTEEMDRMKNADRKSAQVNEIRDFRDYMPATNTNPAHEINLASAKKNLASHPLSPWMIEKGGMAMTWVLGQIIPNCRQHENFDTENCQDKYQRTADRLNKKSEIKYKNSDFKNEDLYIVAQGIVDKDRADENAMRASLRGLSFDEGQEVRVKLKSLQEEQKRLYMELMEPGAK